MDYYKKEDGRDETKVDLNDPNDISYAAQQAGISPEKYKELSLLVDSGKLEKSFPQSTRNYSSDNKNNLIWIRFQTSSRNGRVTNVRTVK